MSGLEDWVGLGLGAGECIMSMEVLTNLEIKSVC